jgi:hypothetical protein
MYTSTNAAPPLLATCVGKPQILPNPTAEPAAANTNPIRDENSPRAAMRFPYYFYYCFE